MSDIPPEAITAAAVLIHDDECNDGDTKTCGRWRSPNHVRHIEFYRDKAQGILEAAAPHITAAERKRLRQRATGHTDDCADGCCLRYVLDDLLGPQPVGADAEPGDLHGPPQ